MKIWIVIGHLGPTGLEIQEVYTTYKAAKFAAERYEACTITERELNESTEEIPASGTSLRGMWEAEKHAEVVLSYLREAEERRGKVSMVSSDEAHLWCDNAPCEAEAVVEVEVSVHEPEDEKRHYCATCHEAYLVGVQHGRAITTGKVGG